MDSKQQQPSTAATALYDPNHVQYIDMSSEEEDDYSSEMMGGEDTKKEESKTSQTNDKSNKIMFTLPNIIQDL